MAVLMRARLSGWRSAEDQAQWRKLAEGLKNNRPSLLAELFAGGRNQTRALFRDTYGREMGDEVRRQGYGIVKFGPIAKAMLRNFQKKLGQCFYYKYVGKPLSGYVMSRHISDQASPPPEQLLNTMLAMAPEIATTKRSERILNDQFQYRSNHSVSAEVFYGIAAFQSQFIFQLFVCSDLFFEQLVAHREGIPPTFLGGELIQCRLDG